MTPMSIHRGRRVALAECSYPARPGGRHGSLSAAGESSIAGAPLCLLAIANAKE